MTKDEIKRGVIDVLIRKNLMDQTQIFELQELLGEDKFYELIFRLSGQTLKVPSADTIWREYRNELIGRTLDECDNRFVRKELKERWNLTSANLSMRYKKKCLVRHALCQLLSERKYSQINLEKS